MTHRFFAGPRGLSAEQRRQIANVLRLGPGDLITVVRDGEESDIRLARVSSDIVEGETVATRAAANEPRVSLTLALPLLKGDRSEEVIEATAQLGVSRFMPFSSARSVVRELSSARRERWQRIAREAAETARRGRAPVVDEARSWPALLAALPPPIVLAWEEERARVLEAALPRGGTVSLVIGPEGGLEHTEVALARERDAAVVSLGRRNLRAETAAIAAVARVIAALDQ